MSKLSAIIPVLNEMQFLVSQQETLKSLIDEGHEVIVVDGGSSDNSVEIAKQMGCKTLVTKPSRGYQLHFGAEHSSMRLT